MTWEYSKIGDHCEIASSKRIFFSEYVEEGVPFYRSKEIIEKTQGQTISEPLFISLEKFQEIQNKYGVPAPGDMLLTSVGTIGIPYLVQAEDHFYFKDGNLTWFRNFDDSLLADYLFYWIRSDAGQGILNNSTIGSSQKALTISTLKQIELPLPPIEIQRRIADILSAYDDLIENNQKQIKLLEEAAQRLYKEWFVDLRFPGHKTTPIIDGVPEGWTKVKLEDVIAFDPRVLLDKERTKQFVPMSALSTNAMTINLELITETTSCSGSKFQNGDTLLARITPCLENGKTAFVNCITSAEGAVGSTEYIVMRSIALNPYMVYCLARTDDFRNEAINSMTGSDGRQRAQKDKIKQLSYLKPPATLIASFEQLAKPMFDRISMLQQQVFRLKSGRDTLLPKLMNGVLEA